jgi:hypothetical protein
MGSAGATKGYRSSSGRSLYCARAVYSRTCTRLATSLIESQPSLIRQKSVIPLSMPWFFSGFRVCQSVVMSEDSASNALMEVGGSSYAKSRTLMLAAFCVWMHSFLSYTRACTRVPVYAKKDRHMSARSWSSSDRYTWPSLDQMPNLKARTHHRSHFWSSRF